MASEPCTVTAITVEWTRSAAESARRALGVCTRERKATCSSCSASKKPRPRCCSWTDSLMKSLVPSSSRSWIWRTNRDRVRVGDRLRDRVRDGVRVILLHLEDG